MCYYCDTSSILVAQNTCAPCYHFVLPNPVPTVSSCTAFHPFNKVYFTKLPVCLSCFCLPTLTTPHYYPHNANPHSITFLHNNPYINIQPTATTSNHFPFLSPTMQLLCWQLLCHFPTATPAGQPTQQQLTQTTQTTFPHKTPHQLQHHHSFLLAAVCTCTTMTQTPLHPCASCYHPVLFPSTQCLHTHTNCKNTLTNMSFNNSNYPLPPSRQLLHCSACHTFTNTHISIHPYHFLTLLQ